MCHVLGLPSCVNNLCIEQYAQAASLAKVLQHYAGACVPTDRAE